MNRKVPEHEKLNTDQSSFDKICLKAKIDELYFCNNDAFEHNSIDATLRFLHDARIKANREGFIDVIIESETRGDGINLPYDYIVVYGWRKETDKEWRTRLNHYALQMKRLADDAERAIKTVTHYRSKQKEIEALLT